MKAKPNYFVIPGITLVISAFGRYCSEVGMSWYRALVLPDMIIPPDWTFGVMWNTIYVLVTVVALWLYNKAIRDRYWLTSMMLLCVNAVANGLWPFFFFYHQLILVGFLDCIVVLVTATGLMLFVGKQSRLMAILLLPYVAWMTYATYANFLIWQLN